MDRPVLNGIDRSDLMDKVLLGARLGVVTTGGAVDIGMRLALDILFERYRVAMLYNTIIGIRGDYHHGEQMEQYIDEPTGLPVLNIFNRERTAPDPEMLEDIDIMVFDIREAGVRYYEYLYCCAELMRACASAAKPLVVLDRVAPLGGVKVEGTVCPPGLLTIVGGWELPIRTALTMGEFALYINSEFGIGCDLTVIPVSGWRRSQYFDETGLPWMLPSPSLPHITANLLYAGMCIFEGVANISEGRGTSKPFELVGAPWLDAGALLRRMAERELPGVRFGRTYFKPYASKYAGKVCSGLQIVVNRRETFDSFRTAITLLDEIQLLHPDRIEFSDCSPGYDVVPLPSDALFTRYIDKLLADTDYSSGLIDGEGLIERNATARDRYLCRKAKYHLYD